MVMGISGDLMRYSMSFLVGCNVGKTMRNHPPVITIFMWYGYHSQSWVVYDMFFPTLVNIQGGSPVYDRKCYYIGAADAWIFALVKWLLGLWRIYPLVNYHNYGKSPCSMGKSTISMVMFNSYVSLPEGNHTVFMGWIPQPTVTCHISPMCATGSSRTYTTQKTKPLKKTTHWYTKSTSLYVIVSLSHILVLLNKCFTSCWGRYCTCWGWG